MNNHDLLLLCLSLFGLLLNNNVFPNENDIPNWIEKCEVFLNNDVFPMKNADLGKHTGFYVISAWGRAVAVTGDESLEKGAIIGSISDWFWSTLDWLRPILDGFWSEFQYFGPDFYKTLKTYMDFYFPAGAPAVSSTGTGGETNGFEWKNGFDWPRSALYFTVLRVF